MTAYPMNPARRRFTWRFVPLMIGYSVLMVFSTGTIASQHPAGSTLAMLALLPAIPLVATIAVLGLYLVEETDEFVRHRHVVAMIWAVGAVLAVATVWGFLRTAGAVDEPPVYLAYPFWCVCYALAQGGQIVADRLAVRP